MADNSNFNESVPSGTSQVAHVDDDIRQFKSDMSNWWEEEHYAFGGSSNSAGVHRTGSARIFYETPAPTGVLPAAQLWFDSADDKTLSAYTGTGWAVVSDTTTGSANSWTAANEFQDAVYFNDVTTGITAFAGGGQASATLLTTTINIVTVIATNDDSVKLPTAAPGRMVIVWNKDASGSNSLAVWPNTGDAINGIGGTFFNVAYNATKMFIAMDATDWFVVQ